MIKKEDIKNLAELSRIEMSDVEAENFAPQIDSILGYVSQINNSTGDLEREIPKLRNVLREDKITNEKEEYTEKLLKNSPQREKNYVKVKKILS
jgi:aspartyl-tRNA(Asn)/glutamyl-tRNA(Gln) amidotransferase subunit C